MENAKYRWILWGLLLYTISCNTTPAGRQGNRVEKTYYPDGKLQSVNEFSNNGLDKKTTKYNDEGGISSVAHYHNGRYTGEAVIYYSNGQKNFEQNYDSSGLPDGVYHLWNLEGQLRETGLYIHGKKEGRWETFTDSGKPETVLYYKDGVRVGAPTQN